MGRSYSMGDRWPAAMAIAGDDSLTPYEKCRQLERIADQTVVVGSCGHPWVALVPKGSPPSRRDPASRFPCPDCMDNEA